jgi:hypothetical protein
MDEDTFTCPNCERTLPVGERANSQAMCRDCLAAESTQTTRQTGDGVESESPTESARANATGPTSVEPFWERDPDRELRVTEYNLGERERHSDVPAEDSLDRKIDSWKEQLLDLTRRNTLVDFSETKTRSLPLAGVVPPRVAGYLREGALTIHRQPDDTEQRISLRGGEVLSTRPPDATAESLYRIGLNEKQFLRERGVETLYLVLGSLQWSTPDEPDEPYTSPLFLSPVDIEQKPVSGNHLHNYLVHSEGDDLLVNPALRKMLSGEVKLDLPPDEALGIECIDAAFEAVHEAISGFDGWHITDDVILGVFDFAKYSIYTDLEQNREAIRSNPFVRALNDDPSALLEADADREPVRADELDSVIDPRDVYQVLDADSSQQEAIEAAKRGRDFVIQGPPGTGKSQTIANIIAEKIAAGETVLFVSEKQAALNVVKNRLDDVGVGRFCLEAHGRKASKSAVLSSLETELQSNPVKDVPDRETKLAHLVGRRETLNEYGQALLEPPDGFAVSPYEAFGNVAVHRDIPTINIGIDSALTRNQAALDSAEEKLSEIAYFDDELARYDDHLWRHTTVSRWRIDTGDRVRDTLDEYATALESLAEITSDIESAFGLEIRTPVAAETANTLLQHLTLRPSVTWRPHHFSSEFRDLGDELEEFATHMERLEALRADLLDKYEESFLGADGQALHSQISRYGALRFIRPGYYSVRDQIKSHTVATYDPTFAELEADTRALMELQQRQENVAAFSHVESALGPLYKGAATDWNLLLEVHDWITRLFEYPFELKPIESALVEQDLPDVEAYQDRLSSGLEAATESQSSFGEIMDLNALAIDGQPLDEATFETTVRQLTVLSDNVDALENWVEFSQHLDDLDETLAATYISTFLDGDYDPEHLVPAFQKQFYTEWLNELYDDSLLGEFNADTFSKYLADFRRLDEEQQELAKVAIQHLVTRERPKLDLEHADSSEQVIVRREIQKQRQHKPLRELFTEAGEFITTLKPCFMMSPLSVAQYLKADAIEFDVVIFDEASQVMPEDAISSIIRADQTIIAGDTKQLPPTRFFDADVDVGEGVREDLDSILEEAAAILPEVGLTWHYRSRTADLIEFSNQLYYNGRLQTFPENDPSTETGVEFEYVENGVYDRGGTRRNDIEADRVVDLITHHATTSPEKSLGVVAFSVAQEEAIRDVLEVRRKDDEALDRFIDDDDILGEFFVKNLEMVQGDERDRMIFSVGYGPDESGAVAMNFGPLNQQGGERRLNVAVTRARERVTVVSSLLPEAIDLSRTSSTGVEHFKRYLEYARDDGRVLSTAQEGADSVQLESAIEQSVHDALVELGYSVDVVSTSGYSIDLAVRASAESDSYQLGIEFDGSAYRWSNTARDRDRIRPTVLEGLGWEIVRLWAPDWVTNRERVLDDLEERLEDGHADRPATHESVEEPDDGIEVATYEPEEYSRAELEAIQQAVGTYRDPTPDREVDVSFEAASQETIHQALASLVLEFGPVHREDAFRAIAATFGEPRRTPTVEETLDKHLRSLQDRHEIIVSEDFLWPQRHDLSFVVRQNESASRSIDRIPLEEVQLAVALILDSGISMTREDLVVETTRLFGYERVGSRIRDRVDAAVDDLAVRGLLDEGPRISLGASLEHVRSDLLATIYT